MAMDTSVIQALTYERGQNSVKELVRLKTANCYALAKYVMYNAAHPALITSYSNEYGSHFAALDIDTEALSGRYIDITGAGPRILPISLDTDVIEQFESGHFGFIGISKYIYRTNKLNTADNVHIYQSTIGEAGTSVLSYPEHPAAFMQRLAGSYSAEELQTNPCACVMELAVDIAYEEAHSKQPEGLPV